MKSNKLLYTVAFLVAIALGAGILALYNDIAHKKVESRAYPMMLNKVSDAEPDFEKWGANFPSQLDGYKSMEQKSEENPNGSDHIEPPFGGSLPYCKIIRWPAATVFWN